MERSGESLAIGQTFLYFFIYQGENFFGQKLQAGI